jgi:hypothetical protein
MQQSGLNKKDQKTLSTALNAYKNANYFPARSSQEIEEIIALARYALTDDRVIEYLSKNAPTVSAEIKKNKDWVDLLLDDLIKKAGKKLRKLQSNEPKYPFLQ